MINFHSLPRHRSRSLFLFVIHVCSYLVTQNDLLHPLSFSQLIYDGLQGEVIHCIIYHILLVFFLLQLKAIWTEEHIWIQDVSSENCSSCSHYYDQSCNRGAGFSFFFFFYRERILHKNSNLTLCFLVLFLSFRSKQHSLQDTIITTTITTTANRLKGRQQWCMERPRNNLKKLSSIKSLFCLLVNERCLYC